MLKITLAQIADTAHLLNNGQPSALLNLRQQRLPAATAFRLKRVAEITDKEFQRYHEALLELLREHGEETQPGNWRPRADRLADFTPHFEALRAETIEIPVTALRPEDLGNAEISEFDLRALDWLFTEATAEAPPEPETAKAAAQTA